MPVIMRGQAHKDDFEEGKASIYSWNIAGSTVFEKGIIQQFMETVQPDILCLNEIKTDPDKIDKKKLFSKMP